MHSTGALEAKDHTMTGSNDGNALNIHLTADSISRLARVCFADTGPAVRFMSANQTKICPLEHVAGRVSTGSRALEPGETVDA